MFELSLIQLAVEKVEQQIKTKNLTKEKLAELNEKLELKPSEYALFQETKSLLHAQGVLSLESATWIYEKLSHYSKCSIAEKYILNELFAKMLQLKTQLIKR